MELPGFSHAVGNPVPAQHTFLRDRHRVVIVEGLYLLHQGQGWDREQFTKLLDLSVYIRYTFGTACKDVFYIRNCLIILFFQQHYKFN